jgi:hypothetical protein
MTFKQQVIYYMKPILATTSSIICGTAILIFGYIISPSCKDIAITYTVILLGILLGWLVGMITTPYDHRDGSKIIKFSTLIGTFISGFLLSKLDKVVDVILSNGVQSELMGMRLLLFACSFILVWIVVFIYRVYI